jgi:hypothetical protein
LVLMQLDCLLLVLNSQVVDFSFIFGDSHEKLGISVLSCQESRDNIINIRVSSGSPDLLERQLNILMSIHFFLHFFFMNWLQSLWIMNDC